MLLWFLFSGCHGKRGDHKEGVGGEGQWYLLQNMTELQNGSKLGLCKYEEEVETRFIPNLYFALFVLLSCRNFTEAMFKCFPQVITWISAVARQHMQMMAICLSSSS